MEENPIQAGPGGPPTLETLASVCNFAFAKAAVMPFQ